MSGECDSGRLHVPGCGSIYYEIRNKCRDGPPLILIMGAFATLRHYNELADFLTMSGYRVLTYDHRGIGRSTAERPKESQTSQMLASDCLALIEHMFGHHPVHVYGASMGGCVAQYVALALKASNRLCSLYLAVTSRGSYFQIPLPQSILKFAISTFIVKSDTRMMVNSLLPKCFDKEFLNSVDERTGRLMIDLWTEKWTAEYADWFSFADLDATASQCPVYATHYLSEDDLKPLVGSNITVHISMQDELITPEKQFELAGILKAKIIKFEGGHILGNTQKKRFYDAVLLHLKQKD